MEWNFKIHMQLTAYYAREIILKKKTDSRLSQIFWSDLIGFQIFQLSGANSKIKDIPKT